MATELTKPIHRETSRIRATKNGRIEVGGDFIPMGARPVIVSLLPDGTFQWRAKGTKTVYTAHLSTLMYVAQGVTIYHDYEKKLEEYKNRKSLNLRTRKPKKPSNPMIAATFRKLYNATY